MKNLEKVRILFQFFITTTINRSILKRIILSRKGFDSSAGGAPSPIMNDGRIFSLPIPQKEKSPNKYKNLAFDEFSAKELLINLNSKVTLEDYCHYDPRLNQNVGIFGQANAAQTELDNNGVQKGDLFLFFGWFKDFHRTGVNLHHLFGWLQIGKIIRGEKDIKRYLKSKKLDHPHGFKNVNRYKNNTLYIGTNRMTFKNKKFEQKGFGLFKKTHSDLILTEQNKTRSNWQLPNDFKNTKNLFMNRLRWSDARRLRLSYKGYGQEFILNVEENPNVIEWALNLIFSHG